MKFAFKETIKAWRRLLRPKVIFTSLFVLVICCLLIGSWLLYQVVTAELTVMFLPNDVYVESTYAEEPVVELSLRANNYLLCEATCNISLESDSQDETLIDTIRIRNNDKSFSITLPKQALGEGKAVYVAKASCVSTGFTSCERSKTPVHESALIVQEYSLTADDLEQKQTFNENYSEFLEVFRKADEQVSNATALYGLILTHAERVRDDTTLRIKLDRERRNIERRADWTYPKVPLAEATILLANAKETTQLLAQDIAIENLRREEIANISIDPRIGILAKEFSSSDWDVFQEEYESGKGVNMSSRYADFERVAYLYLEATNRTLNNTYVDCNCSLTITRPTFSFITLPQIPPSDISLEISSPDDRCVVCRKQTPILFLHGHNMNTRNAPEWQLSTFAFAVDELSKEGLLLDSGVMTPYSATKPTPAYAWEDLPIGIRGTYYYDTYLSGGSYVLSGEQTESIDTYAIRVKELVDTILLRTGAQNVTIVTHSMGGLVTRRYMQLFGDSHVEQVIMIGTPNHGVEGSVATFCSLFGANKQCEEMKANSAMLARINDPSKQPRVPLTVIAGIGCQTSGKDGDGIVTYESATLPNAKMIQVRGSCDSEVYHSTIVQDPQVIDIVRSLLLN